MTENNIGYTCKLYSLTVGLTPPPYCEDECTPRPSSHLHSNWLYSHHCVNRTREDASWCQKGSGRRRSGMTVNAQKYNYINTLSIRVLYHTFCFFLEGECTALFPIVLFHVKNLSSRREVSWTHEQLCFGCHEPSMRLHSDSGDLSTICIHVTHLHVHI